MIKRLRFFAFFFIFFEASSSFAGAALVTRNTAPDFLNASKWLNSKTPVTLQSLQGKVVLVAFWSLSNIQAKQDLARLNEWYEEYHYQTPLAVIGVHSPSYEYERNDDEVTRLIKKRRLAFPIALDSQDRIKNAYVVTRVPVYFLIDAKGRVRHKFDSLHSASDIEREFRTLILEADVDADLPAVNKKISLPGTPVTELRFGFGHPQFYGNTEKLKAEQIQIFQYPPQRKPGSLYFSGGWKPKKDSFEFGKPGSSFKTFISGSKVYLLAGSTKDALVPAEIRWNDVSLAKNELGKDAVIQEGKSYVFVKDYRLYHLIKLPQKTEGNQLELFFEDAGIEISAVSSE